MKLPFILLLAFTSSVLYAAPAGQDLKMIPLSKAELETTNAGLAALVKKVNKDLPGLIVSNKIDPLPRVATGNARKDLFIGICQASASIDYRLENLVGLKSLEITELEITGGELDDATSLIRLQVKGSIKPTQQLHLNVQGFVAAKCGFISPSSGFSAFVNVQGGKISFQASTVIDNSNGIVLKEATLKSIQADFDSMKLELGGLGVVFNPLVGFITEKIQQTLKDSIRSHVENSVKPQLQGLISSHLPFSVPLP